MPSRSLPPLSPLAAWHRVRQDQSLQSAAAATAAGDVAAVARLRRMWSADDVAAALSLADARRRLASKFTDAARLWADREAAEQATSELVAGWKAERFAAAGATAIEDRCCGMGGDAMALARVAATTAIDRSDVRAWMTSVNALCATEVADASAQELRAPFLHIDPARRDERAGRRLFDLADLSPSVGVCFELAGGAVGAAVKLGPGLPLPLPLDLPQREAVEIEFISERGALAQAVCWFGSLARGRGGRTATMLPGRHTMRGAPCPVPVSRDNRFRRHLFVADPALERSGLLGRVAAELGLVERAAGLGILTGDAAVAVPWLRGYEILARPHPRIRDVRSALADLGACGARVRTRGRSADADAWTKALRTGDGPELDVFLLRCGQAIEAIVARPL